MDDYVLRLEFGDGALGAEDKGALFRVVGGLCNKLFGVEKPSKSLRDTVEIVNLDGEYVKFSRLTVRNLGCIIGNLVELEYFSPIDEPYNERLAELEELESEDEDDDSSFIGRHVCMTFDTSDGTFFRSESLTRLYIDTIGEVDLECVDIFDCIEDTSDDEEFNNIVSEEASTPTVGDYFIVNTVKSIVENRHR